MIRYKLQISHPLQIDPDLAQRGRANRNGLDGGENDNNLTAGDRKIQNYV